MAFIQTIHSVKKIYDLLKGKNSRGRLLLLFNHGLGDLINFMPLYEYMKNYFSGRWKIDLGADSKRGFQAIFPNFIEIGSSNLREELIRRYTYVIRISYPEPDPDEKKLGKTKPYLCNEREINIPNFIWKPWKNKYFPALNFNSNRIGVHFFGNTNYNLKNPPKEVAEEIWNEIKEMGYSPFEIHQLHDFTFDQNMWHPSFINRDETIRYEKPNLGLMVNEIQKCRFFIGVDSGPLYLSGSILGYNRLIGLERFFKISWYCPTDLLTTSILYYESGNIKKEIRRLEECLKGERSVPTVNTM